MSTSMYLVPYIGWVIVVICSITFADSRRGFLVPFALMLGILCHLMWRAVGLLSDIAEAQEQIAKATQRIAPKVPPDPRDPLSNSL